ncbi:MAG TPA: hydrogenase expression/formation protein HypE [Gemmatimonadales bacterium]|jgi:hydrogenase expression/formation protein HypE|nr:hydrogenase expression/formation protein HypE [Gemmatimonadales bacterium]
MTSSSLAGGLVCPGPLLPGEVQLGHGSGGTMSAALLRERFLPRLANPALAVLGDAAIVGLGGHDLAISTDSFVVSPLEFPGGNIGSLAVHGTLNDLAMMGAEPLCLAAAFILEEGLAFDVLDRVVDAMALAAAEAGVPVVTGDTKVVERGKADGLYINTTGLGRRVAGAAPRPDRARPGDAILVSGPIGRHGMAIMAEREGIGFETRIESDSATLWPLVERLLRGLGAELHTLRDPTRGGVASALNEIAAASGVGMVLSDDLPVPDAVAAACEMLGLDPLYVANEGICLAIVPAERASDALDLMRSHPLGAAAQRIGRVVDDHPGYVVLETGMGGSRIVSMLPGDQLPRIC